MSSAAEDLVSEPVGKFQFRQTPRLLKRLLVLSGPVWIVLCIALLLRTALPLAAVATKPCSLREPSLQTTILKSCERRDILSS